MESELIVGVLAVGAVANLSLTTLADVVDRLAAVREAIERLRRPGGKGTGGDAGGKGTGGDALDDRPDMREHY